MIEDNKENESGIEKDNAEIKRDSTFKPIDIKLIMVLAGTEKKSEVDIIKSLPVEVLNDGNIIVESIITQLKQRCYPLDNAKISYWSSAMEIFTYCGIDPLARHYVMDKIDQDENSVIIKAEIYLEQETDVLAKDDDDSKGDIVENEDEKKHPEENKKIEENKDKSKSVRVKERKLSVIIERVKKWRDLYYGYIASDGKRVRLSLEEAAAKVGLPKKTLDDYLQQLKLGKKYGFNFNAFKDKKIGELRDFVKKFKPDKKDPKEENKEEEKKENSDENENNEDENEKKKRKKKKEVAKNGKKVKKIDKEEK